MEDESLFRVFDLHMDDPDHAKRLATLGAASRLDRPDRNPSNAASQEAGSCGLSGSTESKADSCDHPAGLPARNSHDPRSHEKSRWP
jgi:hypothetical protein